MSTAIVRIYTPEGFVLAADGRNFHLETRSVASDSIQKIFSVREPHRQIAYSLSGTVGITAKDDDEVVFDFVSEVAKAIDSLTGIKLKSMWHYAEALLSKLLPLPDLAVCALRTFESPLQQTTILFDGYYEGRPKRAHIHLFHDGQEPEVSSEDLCQGAAIGIGSDKVWPLLANDSGPLAGFQTKLTEIETVAAAVESAKRVIAAHCSAEALELDPRCVAMGGHIHVCKISYADGFEWIPGFEPIS